MKRLVSPTRLALTLLAASAFGSQAVAGGNLLINPGFEASGGSYAGWTTFGSGMQLSLPGGDDIARTGIAAAKTFGEFTNCPDFPQFDVGGFFQSFTPTAGLIYEFSGYTFISNFDPIPGTDTCGSNRLIAKVVFFDAPTGGAEISSNEVVIGDWDTPLDEWIEFSVSAPAPTGAARVEVLCLYLQPACDTGAVFVDDTSLLELSPPSPPPGNLLANPSFTGDLTGWSVFGNAFHEPQGGLIRTAGGSGKMFSTFTPESPSGMFQTFAAAPGEEFEMSAYALASCADAINQGANYAVARIVFLDGSATEISGEEVVLADFSSPLGLWTQNSVSAVAPAGTAEVQAFLLFISPFEEGGAIWFDDVFFGAPAPLDVLTSTGPGAIALNQNSPNPFNPSTRITFELASEDVVNLSVYDINGRLVTTLLSGTVGEGQHSASWDGTTSHGLSAATGVYRYVLTTSTGQVSRRMVLAK